MFDDDWFGPVAANSETDQDDNAKVVATGRWAYTPVLTNARDYSNITNTYGLLRSPWNTNPTPYLMRSRAVLGHKSDGYSLPSCSSFATAMGASSSMAEINFALNGILHGPVHLMVGGHWFYNAEKWENVTVNLLESDEFLLM